MDIEVENFALAWGLNIIFLLNLKYFALLLISARKGIKIDRIMSDFCSNGTFMSSSNRSVMLSQNYAFLLSLHDEIWNVLRYNCFLCKQRD